MTYDCIVIGAGPAGASAAYHLARRGFSVLILDRAKLPRYKPCGGLVVGRVADWFDFDFTPAISVFVSRGRFWNQLSEAPVEVNYPSPLWMVHREVFDNFLVEQARNRGAILKDETEVTGLAPSAAGWTVSARDGQFQARYLIAADGAKGMAAVWLGFRERLRKKAAALEAEIPRTQAPEPVLDINMFDNFTGYAWRFPKSCSNSVGIGTWQSASVGLRQLLEGYVRSHDLPMAKASVFGHPLLLWDGDQALHTERALLAGEAGCMVDPFSGEGIRFAMRTGVLAAAAIGDALNGQASALPQYSDRVQKELGSEMKLARALTSVFYTPDIGTREQAIRHPARADLFARLTCGGITYQKFFVATALLNLLVPLSSSRTRAESASA